MVVVVEEVVLEEVIGVEGEVVEEVSVQCIFIALSAVRLAVYRLGEEVDKGCSGMKLRTRRQDGTPPDHNGWIFPITMRHTSYDYKLNIQAKDGSLNLNQIIRLSHRHNQPSSPPITTPTIPSAEISNRLLFTCPSAHFISSGY